MKKKTKLILVRGLPASGKSTLAGGFSGLIGWNYPRFEADDFFKDESGVYRFDVTKIGEAHAVCQNNARTALMDGKNVVVSNTFVERWEMQPYLLLANRFNADVIVVDLFDGGLTDSQLAARNVNGVPAAAIAEMRGRYEHDWANGNIVPPWERN